MRSPERSCDFCGKSGSVVGRIIEGPSTGICRECVDLCAEMFAEDGAAAARTRERRDLPSPRELVRHLDDYVVGQDAAKRTLAVAAYNHFKRVELHRDATPAGGSVEVAKSNVLLLGPTGCGKTYLAQTMARALDVPFAVVDATSLTEAGYVGDDVDTVLLRLLAAADQDVDRAQTGIIYVDEVDKIGRREGGAAQSRDVSGEGVQQALLKILEGSVVPVSLGGGRSRSRQETITVDTRHILFVAAGAFSGLEDIVSTRAARRTVGFGVPHQGGSCPRDRLLDVRPGDLTRFGLIPEFVGRFPVVTTVEKLDVPSLTRILVEPRNSLMGQYQAIFASDGVDLVFDDEAVELVAEEAGARDTGARGLRAIMESVLEPLMFELPGLGPGRCVTVSGDMVRQWLGLGSGDLERTSTA